MVRTVVSGNSRTILWAASGVQKRLMRYTLASGTYKTYRNTLKVTMLASKRYKTEMSKLNGWSVQPTLYSLRTCIALQTLFPLLMMG